MERRSALCVCLVLLLASAVAGHPALTFDTAKVGVGCKDPRDLNVGNVWEPLVLHEEKSHAHLVPPYKYFQYMNAPKQYAGTEIVHFDFINKNYPCPPGSIIVDGGANVGIYTAVYAAMGCPVLAFEPITGDVAGLTVVANKREADVCLVEAALAEQASPSATMILNERYPEGNWLQPDAKKWLDENMHQYLAGYEGAAKVKSVPVVVLDDYLDSVERVHLLKLDLEGGELLALKGALRAIRARKIFLMIIEVWKKPDVLELLAENGYSIWAIKYEHTGYLFHPLERQYWPTYEGDVFARLV
eukprot:tig00001486_g8922.t1